MDFSSDVHFVSARDQLSDDERALAYRFAHVPLPADAVDCSPWHWHGGDDWRRHLIIREWAVGGIWVCVAGEQTHRGEVWRWLHVGGEDQCTAVHRKQLIAALAEAGDLLESLSPRD